LLALLDGARRFWGSGYHSVNYAPQRWSTKPPAGPAAARLPLRWADPGVDLGIPYAVRGAGPEQFYSLCGTVTDNLDNLPLLAEAIHGAEGVRRSRVAEE
jgi:hypothetical protein